MAMGKNIMWKKGSNIIFPLIFEAVEKNIEGVRGRKFWERKSGLKKWGWGRISSCRELYTPLFTS